MKKVTTPELISLVGIAIAAPVLALAIVISARANGASENDVLLFSLALCGVVMGAINGFGRRTIKGQSSLKQYPQRSTTSWGTDVMKPSE